MQSARAIQERGKFNELGDTYARLGDLASDQNQPNTAEQWFQKAYAWQLATQGEGSTITWSRLGSMSEMLAHQGNYAQAISVRDQVTAGFEGLGKSSEQDALLSRFSAGMLKRDAGELTQALVIQAPVFEQLRTHISADDPVLASLRVQFAFTNALQRTPEGLRQAQALIDDIGSLRAVIAPTTMATYLLTQAMLSTDRAERDRHLAAMDTPLALMGSGARRLQSYRLQLPTQ